MEPHAALAEWEDGRLTLWTGTQTPFNTRADLAGAVRAAAEERRARRRAADGRLVRRQDVRPARGARRRARAQGRPAGEGGARPRGGVRHASTATRRRSACASARSATARWWPRSSTAGSTPAPTPTAGRAWRRRWATRASARTGSRTCASTRSRSTPTCRPTAPTAATGRCSRSGRPSGRWTCWRSELGMSPLELRRREPAARRRRVRHRRGHARRPLRGVPARRRRDAVGYAEDPRGEGPVRAAEGHADAEPGGGPRRAHAGRLRRAQRVVRDGPGRARLDPADGGRAARLRAGPGRGAGPRHRHAPVRHPHHLEPLDAHDGPRARRGRPRPARQRRRARLRRGRQRGRAGPRHRPGGRLHPLAPGRRRARASASTRRPGS